MCRLSIVWELNNALIRTLKSQWFSSIFLCRSSPLSGLEIINKNPFCLKVNHFMPCFVMRLIPFVLSLIRNAYSNLILVLSTRTTMHKTYLTSNCKCVFYFSWTFKKNPQLPKHFIIAIHAYSWLSSGNPSLSFFLENTHNKICNLISRKRLPKS